MEVTLLVPREDGSTVPKTFASLDQVELNIIMSQYGADGFLREDGKLSRKLADLREGGTYELVAAERPGLDMKVSPPVGVPSPPLCTARTHFRGRPCRTTAGGQPEPAGSQPAGPLG